MDIIINELSLHGQFSDSRSFWERAALPFQDAIQDAVSHGSKYLFKRGDLYAAMVTPDKTFHTVMIEPESRIIDKARKYKSVMARAIHEPYWDQQPVQDENIHYHIDDTDISGTSIAEAAARSACLVSFIDSCYTKHPIAIKQNEESVAVNNIWQGGQLYSILHASGEMALDKYIKTRFGGGKLNFEQIDDKNGFQLITSENENEFIDSFRKFDELSWAQISTDTGLDYKDYTKNKRSKPYFSKKLWQKGIKKFRVTQRNRCFGYVEKSVFYVLRFDLDHELSDLG